MAQSVRALCQKREGEQFEPLCGQNFLFVCLFGEGNIKDFRGICALRVPFSSFTFIVFCLKKYTLAR